MGVTYINPYRFGFNPLSLSPAGWYDASDSSTITASGGAISQWSDKSGNARNLAQAAALAQPSYVSNVQNGLAVVRSASSQFMQATYGSISQPITVVAAIRVTSSSTAYRSWMVGASLATDTGVRIDCFTQSSLHRIFAGTASVGTAAATATNAYVIGNVFNGASSAVFVNGAAAGTGNPGSGGIRTTLSVGRYDSSAFQGDLCEVLIFFAALSVSNRAQVESYLNAKWAVY